jgi:hypothetical protein
MQDAWGIEFAEMRERRRMIEREKKRRQRALQAIRKLRPSTVLIVRRPTYDVFETRSGMKAVRSRQARADGMSVSLPYVEFLHGDAS